MKLSASALLRKTVGRGRQRESLVQFKPLSGLPETAGINEEDIPWAVLVENQPLSEMSHAHRPVQAQARGVPPIPVLIALPILIALMGLFLAE